MILPKTREKCRESSCFFNMNLHIYSIWNTLKMGRIRHANAYFIAIVVNFPLSISVWLCVSVC